MLKHSSEQPPKAEGLSHLMYLLCGLCACPVAETLVIPQGEHPSTSKLPMKANNDCQGSCDGAERLASPSLRDTNEKLSFAPLPSQLRGHFILLARALLQQPIHAIHQLLGPFLVDGKLRIH